MGTSHGYNYTICFYFVNGFFSHKEKTPYFFWIPAMIRRPELYRQRQNPPYWLWIGKGKHRGSDGGRRGRKRKTAGQRNGAPAPPPRPPPPTAAERNTKQEKQPNKGGREKGEGGERGGGGNRAERRPPRQKRAGRPGRPGTKTGRGRTPDGSPAAHRNKELISFSTFFPPLFQQSRSWTIFFCLIYSS